MPVAQMLLPELKAAWEARLVAAAVLLVLVLWGPAEVAMSVLPAQPEWEEVPVLHHCRCQAHRVSAVREVSPIVWCCLAVPILFAPFVERKESRVFAFALNLAL